MTLVFVLQHSFENHSNNKIVAYVPAPPVCPLPLLSARFAANEAIGIDCVPDGGIDDNTDGCMDPGTAGVTTPTLPAL